MSDEETKKLLDELRTWVEAEYGRRAEIARELDVSRQRVTDWLSDRYAPTLEQGLRLQAFLKKQRRQR